MPIKKEKDASEIKPSPKRQRDGDEAQPESNRRKRRKDMYLSDRGGWVTNACEFINATPLFPMKDIKASADHVQKLWAKENHNLLTSTLSNDSVYIVFLDVDGVLKPHLPRASLTEVRAGMKLPQLDILRRILRISKAKVVITSSWRRDPMSLAILIHILTTCSPEQRVPIISNMNDVIGMTRLTKTKTEERFPKIRTNLIQDWISSCGLKILGWVAIDDMRLELPPGNFIHTDMNVGLEQKHVYEALKKLGYC